MASEEPCLAAGLNFDWHYCFIEKESDDESSHSKSGQGVATDLSSMSVGKRRAWAADMC
jgi:hypothetical protein